MEVMMQIFFAEHRAGRFPDRRTELQIIFTNKKGRPYRGNYGSEYTWTPQWEDLQLIFLLAYHVERLNRGQCFKPLVEVAEEVYIHYKEFLENPKPGHDKWGFKVAP
jgi:hypothetical protein